MVMLAAKRNRRKAPESEVRTAPDRVAYSGKQTKTGNSTGFRFEAGLFKSHPEFSGRVSAQVIAPGRMLVIAETVENGLTDSDPVLDSFLAFLGRDMIVAPSRIQPLNQDLVGNIRSLTADVDVSDDEFLGNEGLLG